MQNFNSSSLKGIQSKLAVVLAVILVFRVGSYIPIPGMDPERLADFFVGGNTILGMFNNFTGGALSRFSLFAVGIMPYISSSIIMQLLSTIVPALEELKKEGEIGKQKIASYTRYLTILIASAQSIGLLMALDSQNAVLNSTFSFYFISCLTMVTGTLFLVWLGEQATEFGIGNGISTIIFAGIAANIPATVSELFKMARTGQIQGFYVLFLLLLTVGLILFITYVERAQRKISISYAQRTQGRKVFAAQKSHLPLKINMSGVIPPIFASSVIIGIIQILTLLSNYTNVASQIQAYLSPGKFLYFFIFSFLVVFLAFFYNSTITNPNDIAQNLKKSNAIVPGIRPGIATADYIDNVMSKLTLVGGIYIAFICVLPDVITYTYRIPYIGGTSLLIAVVVVIEFISQLQSHLMSNQYESLMKKNNLRTKRNIRKGK